MLKTIALVLLTHFSAPLMAETLNRSNITSCAYQAGTAYEIQIIRQTEGHQWDQFEANIKDIYKDTQGRQDLLTIARQVYIQPKETSADAIHDQLFKTCVDRQQGNEPLT